MSLVALIGVRVLLGLGEAGMLPGSYNLIGQWVPLRERSRATSLMVSGIPAGTVLSLLLAGPIVVQFGWPSVFYVFGGLGILWAVCWFILAPKNPSIRPAVAGAGLERERIPWRALLSTPSVWALICCNACNHWGVSLIVSWLPSYFKDVHGFGMTRAGLSSIAPWITMFIMINAGAYISDRMIVRGVEPTTVRKVVVSVGLATAALFFLLVTITSSPLSAMLMVCGIMGGFGISYSGFAPSAVDLAPRHAGVLHAIAVTIGQIPGSAAVAATGWLVQSTGSYTSPFVAAAVVAVFGIVIWSTFGSARPALPSKFNDRVNEEGEAS
jgi:ACS family sodium-dependent inorganic phosphate cotransporter